MTAYAMDDLSNQVGVEVGTSDWLTIDQERIDRFADVTGDHQWIHVDPERAGQGGPTARPSRTAT